MKYKVCSMLLAAALAFPCGRFPPGPMLWRPAGTSGKQQASRHRQTENFQTRRAVRKRAPERTAIWTRKIVVTGTAETEEADGADASGTGADGGNEEIMVFGLSDLDTDEEGNLRSADAGALDTMLQNTVSWLKGSQSSVLNDDFLSGVSSTATDWTAFSLGRLGISDNYSGFLAAADAYV